MVNRIEINYINKINLHKARIYNTNGYLVSICPEGNYLYDISNRANPNLISEFNLASDENGNANIFMGLLNKRAYFNIGYSGIEVIDFQNVNKPVSLDRMTDLLVGNRWEFYADQYLITNPKISVIYDITSLVEPKTIYKFDEEIIDFVLTQNYLMCAMLNGEIRMFDIIQPSSPRLISSLNIKVVKLVTKDSKIVLAEGVDSAVYALDISNPANMSIITRIEIPGPIATGSLICKDGFLYVRFMSKMVGDTTYAFDVRKLNKPRMIFSFKSVSMPLYKANEKLLVFMGIKDWDGINAISKYTASFYKVFNVQSDKVTHIDDIELNGVWFSSIEVLDSFIYIARADGIYIYEVTSE